MTTLWVLWVGLLLATAWSGVVLVFGTGKPIEVVSGRSMLPTLRTGDVVVVRSVPWWQLHAGEIVAVRVPRSDQLRYHYPPSIVHRIQSISVQGNTLILQTKGDNEGPDPFTVPASAVRGALWFVIPYLGYGFLFLGSELGHIALLGSLALALLYALVVVLLGVLPEGPEQASFSPPSGLAQETSGLAQAIREYGEHLRSHTRVVQELGATVASLREAAQTQNEVLDDLRRAMAAWPVAPISAQTLFRRRGAGSDATTRRSQGRHRRRRRA